MVSVFVFHCFYDLNSFEDYQEFYRMSFNLSLPDVFLAGLTRDMGYGKSPRVVKYPC